MTKGIWQDGQLASLNISSLTGKERLSVEDVGADSEKANREIVRLGTKELFDREMLKELRRAEVKARNSVYMYSTEFPIGHLRFVTNQSLASLTTIFEEAKKEHSEAVDKLTRQFDYFKGQMIERYPDQLSESNYNRTFQLLRSGRCQIRLSTFTLDMADKSEEQALLNEFVESAIPGSSY